MYSQDNNYKKFLFYLLLFINPLLIFINNNVSRLDLNKFKIFFEISVILFSYILLLSLILYYLFKIIKIRSKYLNILGILFIFFFISFYHYDIKYLLPLGNLNSEIALLIVILISIFFVKIILYNDKKFIKNICYFFIIFSFLYYGSLIIYKLSLKRTSDINLVTDIDFTIKNSEFPNRNMYLIINDAATSLELFEKYFDENIKDEFVKEVSKYNYKYIEDSYSSYNQTELTFSSIFHMNYFLDEKSERYQDIKKFYPQILKYNFENLALIKLLNKIGYKFYFVGNTRGNCKDYLNKNCIYFKKTRFDRYIHHINMLGVFLLKTPFIAIFNKIYEKVKKSLKIPLYKNNFKNNDAIGKFINNVDIKNYPKKAFFLIHNFYPHLPYVYNEDCSKRNSNEIISTINTNIADKNIGYYKSYLCSLKKTIRFIKYLNKYDKDAVVIFQSDHGKYFKSKNKKEKLNIFNLIKNTEHCEDKINNQIDNVNAVRFLLTCATQLEFEILPKKTFWAPYLESDKNWGKLEKIN